VYKALALALERGLGHVATQGPWPACAGREYDEQAVVSAMRITEMEK